MRMNHAEIIHIEVKYFLMNTARNANMLINHYIILFDNEFDNYNLSK